MTEVIDIVVKEQGAAAAAANIAGIGKASSGVGLAMGGLTKGLMGLAATAGATAISISALTRQFANFEQQMLSVKAASSATEEQMRGLSQAARDIGLKSAEGATKVGSVMEELVKAGVSAEDVMNGTAKAVVAMSQATGSDMASGAGVAANAMLIYNKRASEMAEVAQGATAVINQTTFDLNDYRLALSAAGAVAKTVGVDMMDFNATIAAAAPNFSGGSDEGTAFKTFLLALTPTSKTAKDAIERLDLEFRNADGSMKDMASIADELRLKMGGLTNASREAAIKIIFGNDAFRMAAALYEQGGDRIRKFREEIIPTTDVAGQAATRFSGLANSFSMVKANVEELAIVLGEAGLGKAFQDLTEDIAGSVKMLSEFIKQMAEAGNLSNYYKKESQIEALAKKIDPVAFKYTDLLDPDSWRLTLEGYNATTPEQKAAAKMKEEMNKRYNAARAQAVAILNRKPGDLLRVPGGGGPAAEAKKTMGSIDMQFSEDGETERAAKTAERLIERRADLLSSVNREMADQVKLTQFDTKERQVQAELMRIEEQLISQGLEQLAGPERAALETNIRLTVQRVTAQRDLDEVIDQATGRQDRLTERVVSLNEAISKGGAALGIYQQMLQDTQTDIVQLRIEQGQGSFADGFLLELNRMMGAVDQFAASAGRAFAEVYEKLGNGFADAFGRAIVYGENFGTAVLDIARSALSELISQLAQVGIQWLLNATIGKTVRAGMAATNIAATQAEAAASTVAMATTTTASIGAAAATATAWAPAAAAVSLGTAGANAAGAGIGMTTIMGLALALFAGLAVASFAQGGRVRGKGSSTSDSIPAMLSNGEYVVNARAAQQNMAALEAINSGGSVRGNGGSTISMINNITVPGVEPTESARQARQIADQIDQRVRKVLRDEKRVGGLLSA